MNRILASAALVSIALTSCMPSAEDNARATEDIAQMAGDLAMTMIAITAEFDSKVAAGIEQTQLANPTMTEAASFIVESAAAATITPYPTATQTFTPTRTATTSPSATQTFTPTPTATTSPSATNTPTNTPTPEPLALVNVDWGNLRSGPGTVYAVVAQLEKRTALTPLQRTEGADWFRVEVIRTGEQGWISHTIVIIDFVPETIAVAQLIPLPTDTPTPTATNTQPPPVTDRICYEYREVDSGNIRSRKGPRHIRVRVPCP